MIDIKSNFSQSQQAQLRLELGQLLRLKCKDLWRACLLFACAVELAEIKAMEASLYKDPFTSTNGLTLSNEFLGDKLSSEDMLVDFSHSSVKFIGHRYDATLIKFIILEVYIDGVLRLDNIWAIRPMFDVSLNYIIVYTIYAN